MPRFYLTAAVASATWNVTHDGEVFCLVADPRSAAGSSLCVGGITKASLEALVDPDQHPSEAAELALEEVRRRAADLARAVETYLHPR